MAHLLRQRRVARNVLEGATDELVGLDGLARSHVAKDAGVGSDRHVCCGALSSAGSKEDECCDEKVQEEMVSRGLVVSQKNVKVGGRCFLPKSVGAV